MYPRQYKSKQQQWTTPKYTWNTNNESQRKS